MFGRIVLAFLLVSLASAAVAQPAPGEIFNEAPESLLELNLGDADVDLFASGGGTAGIAGGLGLAVYTDENGVRNTAFPSPFPGLETQPFSITVDLTISLWLLQRYFFETTVTEDLSRATFLLGYQGGPDESVQSVLLGNTAIEMSSYPYLGFGDSTGVMGRDAAGVSALFQTDRSSHEVMLRFEPSEEQELRYVRGELVTITSIDSSDYVRDRFFILPDDALQTLSIYMESPTGTLTGSDGRNYRELDAAGEATLSLADGTILFDEKPSGRVVVYYESQGLPVGHPLLGENAFFLLSDGYPDRDQPADFSFGVPGPFLSVFGGDDFQVTIGGRDGVIIHEPGRYSPFTGFPYYEPASSAGNPSEITFLRSGNRLPVDLPLIARDGPGPLFEVVSSGNSVRDYDSRYPFALDDADPSVPDNSKAPEIYGPAPVTEASEFALGFPQSVPSEAIVLDSAYIPGSVRVLRNGRSTDDFEVSDSGELLFSTPLTDLDTVIVNYRTATSGAAGDLLAGLGNRFTPLPGLDLTAALGMRWKPVQSRYSSTPGEFPGYVSLSGAAEYAPSPQLTLRGQAGMSYSVTDTSGILRLAGMQNEPFRISMSAASLFPSPAPAEDPDTGDSIDITAATRGALIHRDMTAPGFLGQREYQRYDWETPAEQIFPYAAGGRIGPYSAISSDTGDGEYNGTVLIMEYDLAAGENWVGGISRIAGGEQDLSDVTRIEGQYRSLSGGGDVRIFLQIGAIAEDLDGDGTLDSGVSGLSPFFDFDDASSGLTLQAGAVSASRDEPYTEDADGDGRADPELGDLIVTRELDPVTPPPPPDPDPDAPEVNPWESFSFFLTRDEQRLLRATRAARIIIQRDAADGLGRAGRLVFSDLELRGSPVVLNAPAGADVQAAEVVESTVTGNPLQADGAFPAVASRLEDPGAPPTVLLLDWSGLGTDFFVAKRRVDPVPASDYASLRLYAQSLGTDVSVTVRAIAAGGEVIAESPETVSTEWTEITVALPESDTREIVAVETEVTGADAGQLLIDEISLWEPRSSVGATGIAELDWRPETRIAAGSITILDQLRINQRFEARSAGYADGLSATLTGGESTSSISARILGATTDADVSVRTGPAGDGLTAGHSINLPLPVVRFSLREQFRRSYLSYGESLVHGSEITLGPLGPASLGTSWQLNHEADESTVTWTGASSLGPRTDEGIPITASIDLVAEQKLSEALTSAGYPEEWLRSYNRVVPAGDAISRELGATGGLDVKGRYVSANLDLAASTSAVPETVPAGGSAGKSLRTAASAAIAVPVSAGDLFRLTAAASRSGTYRQPGFEGSTFRDDYLAAGAQLADQPYLATSIPVYELWDADLVTVFSAATDGLASAEYVPSASLEIRRDIESSPWSLVIPTGASLSTDRTITREEDTVSERRSSAASLSFIAPNLFGRLGSTPLFTFYDSDEIVTRISVGADRRKDGRTDLEADLDQDTSLLWLSGERLELETAARVNFEPATLTPARGDRLSSRFSLQGRFTWSRAAAVVDRFPRLSALLEQEPAFEHTETVAIEREADREESVTGEQQTTSSQRATVKHETALTFGETGRVSLYAGLGIGTGLQPGQRVFLTGVQLGIEGTLRL